MAEKEIITAKQETAVEIKPETEKIVIKADETTGDIKVEVNPVRKKDWVKIFGYLIPILALLIANMLNVEDPSEIESQMEILLSAIIGILTTVGVVKTNEKPCE